jgi:hypothetical protein
MPAISPQGSRTGLVTALVIFVILFVTTTILYIYENAERRNLQDRAADLEKRQSELVSEATMGGADVTQLLEAARTASSTAMDTVLAQRKQLAKTITGQELPPDKVNTQVVQVMTRATAPDVAPEIPKTASLSQVVTALSNRLSQERQNAANLQKQLEAANAEKQQVIAAREAMRAEKDKQIADINAKVEQSLVETASYRTSNQGRVAAIEKTTSQALGQAQENNTQITAQLHQANATIAQLQRTLEELTRRLKGIRGNTNESTIQKPDATIARVPDNDTVVINRGLGDQIVQGMTFEVYDWQAGVPALGDGMRDGDMPKGKASIEVIRMGPGYSECRIIRRTPGYGLVVGDLCVNLVYDATQKYNFVVYGDFDLANAGHPNPGDADVIKRLITQWGGKVVNEVNINTDFVIMGVEPKAEPIQQTDDAIVKQQKLEAQQALDRYLDTLKQATNLNIPIMNQNRFLNFVGYQSQANR